MQEIGLNEYSFIMLLWTQLGKRNELILIKSNLIGICIINITEIVFLVHILVMLVQHVDFGNGGANKQIIYISCP